jgi:predicted DNA-binding protein (MmcQ/YjbR family)
VTEAEALHVLRKTVLAWPATVERETWGHPTFRVKDKIFATAGDGIVTFKADKTAAAAGDDPRFFIAAYVGRYGWLSVKVNDITADELIALVRQSWLRVAPRKLAAVLDE